jgi:nucleotide-binding universal stress UspA family protein
MGAGKLPLHSGARLMTYKTILVHAQDDPATEARVRLAVSVAGLFDAAVFGVAAESWFPVSTLPEYGYVPGEVIADLEREALGRLESAKHKCRAVGREAGCEVLWTSELDTPREALLLHARSADLIVASRPEGVSAEGLVARPAELVLGAGLPILLKSDRLATITAEHVIVGWKNTRESRRAISEAMPFLRRAKGVTLAQVAPTTSIETMRADLDAAAGRLHRQGVAVSTEAVTESAHVCEALESLAARRGADLIVLGAYGHSRLRETVLGGVTQGFIERGMVHVLLSH